MLHESRSVNFAKFAPLIRSLVDTSTLLAENNAAFLVQATEQVEVTDDMRTRFATLLRTTCAASSLITASFLFVDTKLLTAYTRPKTTGVHPIDVFLLSIFLTSQLDPLLRDSSSSPVAALPVADYSDHSGGATTTATAAAAATISSATESNTATTTNGAPSTSDNPMSAPVVSPRSTSATSPASTRSEPILPSVSDDGGVVGGTLSGLSLPAVEGTIAATTAFLSSAVNGFTGASDATATNEASSSSTATSTSASRNASTNTSVEAPLFKVLFLRPGDKPVSTARELSARRVYIARLMGKITFVAVLRDDSGAAGSHAAEEQRAALDTVRDELGRSLLKDYAEYLQTRAQVHVSMLNYVYDLPGLVHFIFVDRTAHRVLVPTVTPLHGQDCTVHTPESSARMTNILRKEIWSMVSFAQSSLVRGSISTLVRRGAFLYSSRLWIEDGDGFELIVEHPLFSDAALVRDANAARVGDRTRHRLLNIDDGLGDDDRSVTTNSGSGGSGGGGSGGASGGGNDDEWASTNSNTWGAEFYPALVQRLYPTQRYVRIYELYTLYIGMLTAQHIAVCDRKLLSSLQIAS